MREMPKGLEGVALITKECPHGHIYGTCLMCYHDLVGEQQSEIERLSEEIRLMRIENDALVESVLSLRKALGARDNKETLQALRAVSEPENKT